MSDGQMWMVIRTDETGNSYLVRDELGESDANMLVGRFSGHKQSYWAIPYGPGGREQTLQANHVIV
jgi:hypothetical protein